MSRLNAPPGAASSRPSVNVYTGLAFVAMAASLGAMIYMLMRFAALDILHLF